MINILILEDEYYTRRFIKSLVSENPIVKNIYDVSSSKEAINLVNQHDIHIAILDIELKREDNLNGLETAKIIKNHKNDLELIFITGYSRYVIDSFSVHPFDYILKPINIMKFKETLNSLIKKIQEKNHFKNNMAKIAVKNNNEILFVLFNEILFFEKQGKDIKIQTNKNSFLYKNHTLNELENKLPKNFIRVHQSFIVNKDKIRKIRDLGNRSYEIVFEDTNETALMSRYKFEKLKNQIIHSI